MASSPDHKVDLFSNFGLKLAETDQNNFRFSTVTVHYYLKQSVQDVVSGSYGKVLAHLKVYLPQFWPKIFRTLPV